MTPRISIWGDLHIGRMLTLLGEETGLRLHRRFFRHQINESRKDGATHLVIVGDIFDDPTPTHELLILLFQVLHAVRDMQVVVYPGNHDYQDANVNSLRLMRQLPEAGALRHVTFVTEPTLLDWAGQRIHVMPWGFKPPKTLPDANLVFMHDDVAGATQDSGRHVVPADKGFRADSFGNALVISGHIHTPQRVGRVLYCGTAAQFSFGEKPNKRQLLITQNDGLKVSSRTIVPPWTLQSVNYSEENPPDCTDPNTYYKLRIGEVRPSPKWLVQHPNIIKVDGGTKRVKNAATNVVSLIEGQNINDEDETKMVSRWLRNYSTLDDLSRSRAIKEHIRLAGT